MAEEIHSTAFKKPVFRVHLSDIENPSASRPRGTCPRKRAAQATFPSATKGYKTASQNTMPNGILAKTTVK
jgi:hypothetical protein